MTCLCLYPIDILAFDYLDHGDCLNDADGDDICDENEIPNVQMQQHVIIHLIATDDDPDSCLLIWILNKSSLDWAGR